MVERYAMLSNVKSLELATKELEEKMERINKLEEELDYYNKIKKEKEDEIKTKIKKLNEDLRTFTANFVEKKK